MPLIERYILRRATYVLLLTLGALTAALWVAQVLRELDVVTAKGQAIWVFLLVTVLGLPALLQVIAPIAYLVATVVTLSGLNNDSELAAISAAGAPRRAVHRPVLALGVAVTVLVALSHHVLAPASLAALRGLLTQVRADVIASVVTDGGFRTLDDDLTIHIREKAPDGSFRGIFVSDDRNPQESLGYTASQGMLIGRADGSFLVMQDGHLIRENRVRRTDTVVQFETYALDLSQLSGSGAAAFYRARERSTLYLLQPEEGDSFNARYPERIVLELHERMTSPLYTLAFGLIALGFLGRAQTSRENLSFAIAAVVLLSLALRAAGFAALAAGRSTLAVVPLLYLLPLAGMAFGGWAALRAFRLRSPAPLQAGWAAAAAIAGRATGRRTALPSAAVGPGRR